VAAAAGRAEWRLNSSLERGETVARKRLVGATAMIAVAPKDPHAQGELTCQVVSSAHNAGLSQGLLPPLWAM